VTSICVIHTLLWGTKGVKWCKVIINNRSMMSAEQPLWTEFYLPHIISVGWDSGSRYSDSLWTGRSGDWMPVGARFFAPTPDRPWGTTPSFLYSGYWVSFLGVKWPGHDANHQPSPSAEVKESVELYLYSPSGLHGLCLNFTFTIFLAILELISLSMRRIN
jgi:hypothetical protein